MHRKLLHDTGLRSADLDALQLIHRRDLAFDQFRDLGADVGQLLGHVAAQVLVDLDDLQLGLRNLSLALRHCRDELSALAFRRAPSRSSAVTRVMGTRFFCERSRTPSSPLDELISFAFAPA